MSGKIGVALTKTACPVCGNTQDGDIVINTRLSVTMAKKVESLQGKVTRFEVCQSCQKVVDDGYVRLVECDKEKSPSTKEGTLKPENACRTGRIFDVKMGAYIQMFSMSPPNAGFAFIDQGWGNLLAGLTTKNLSELHDMTDGELRA